MKGWYLSVRKRKWQIFWQWELYNLNERWQELDHYVIFMSVFGLMIRRGLFLYVIFIVECLGWFPIKSLQSRIVMIGMGTKCLGMWVRVLCHTELVEFESLWSFLSNIFLGKDIAVEAFCWLAIASKISTLDNLRRRGLRREFVSDMCCLCGKERESIDHLLIHCNVSSAIRGHFLRERSVEWCFLGSLSGLLEAWRGSLMAGCINSLEAHSLFYSLVYLERE